MARKKKATLRYYTRFKEDFGHIRAVIRYEDTRKYITTPLIITAEQRTRLDTFGHINQPQGNTDHLLEERLKRYTGYIWRTVKPLILSGEFATMPTEALAAAIKETQEEDEAKRDSELTEYAGRD